MIARRLLVLAFTAAALCGSPVYAQSPPENQILLKTAAAVLKVEPHWTHSVNVCSDCPPLTDEQLGVASGSWHPRNDDRDLVTVNVHRMRTAAAAARYRDVALRNVHKGWTTKPYDAGDGAVLATYPDSRGFTQYQLTVWKREFLIVISARSQERLAQFIQFVLEAVPPKALQAGGLNTISS